MADPKGLKGVVVAQTELCSIDGEQGVLMYRGYDIADLAEHSTFGEVAYLLLRGELPTSDQLEVFEDEREANRSLSPTVQQLVDASARAAAPMEMLRSAVSATSYDDPDKDSNTDDANHRKSIRLVAKMPHVIGRYQRRREGLDPVEPDPELDWSANFLHVLRGEGPTEREARIFDIAMILHAEHEMNASTFTARVVAATLADLHSAVVAAISALKGPLHGGANEWVMNTLERIGSVDRIEGEVKAMLERGEKVPGFGHPVYKTTDPRAKILKRLSRELSEEADGSEPNWYELTERFEEVVMAEKGLHANVDLYSGSVYRYLGIPTDLFTPLFAASRVVGWSAHIAEQHRNNKIIRPSSEYIGPGRREFAALSQRS